MTSTTTNSRLRRKKRPPTLPPSSKVKASRRIIAVIVVSALCLPLLGAIPRCSGLTVSPPRNDGSSRIVNVGINVGGNSDPVGTDGVGSVRDDVITDPAARTNVAQIMTATPAVTAAAADGDSRRWHDYDRPRPARRDSDDGTGIVVGGFGEEDQNHARTSRVGRDGRQMKRQRPRGDRSRREPRGLQIGTIERPETGGGDDDDDSDADNNNVTKTLETTYDADNGSFGNMFLVKNANLIGNLPGSLELVIHTLSIHTDVEEGEMVSVEVYTRPDAYEGFETDSEEWTAVANVEVVSSGIDKPTTIPSDSFDDVVVPPGKTQAFYVTLTTEDLRYTDADDAEFGSVYVSSRPSLVAGDGGNFQILVGAGVLGHPFGPLADKPRIFNGAIIYTQRRPATPTPTLAPTKMEPTSPPTADPLRYGEEAELNTTFESGNGGFGSFFTILAHETLRITSFDFHTDMEVPLRVEVYTKKGEFGGHETRRESWRRICAATVRGRGENVPTVIPPSSFSSVKIDAGETASFYVTLTTEDLRYSNSDGGVGSRFVQTSSLEVLVGAGVSGYPAFDEGNGVFNSRVFNGIVHYKTLLSDRNETKIDMGLYPTENKLTSTYEGGTGGYGAMFTISAKVQIVVTSLSFHMDSNDRSRVEIWTMAGSYVGYESDRGSWLKIADEYVYGRGTSEPTEADQRFDPVVVMAGDTQSFYVTIGTTNMRYTRTDLSAGDEFKSNDEVSIMVGTGVAYPFGKLYSPRVFNGDVNYRIYKSKTQAPTPSPTRSRTPLPRKPLLTQQRISVAGVSARRFLQTFFPNGEFHRRLELGDESVAFFEDTTSGFVQSAGNESGIDVTSVIVSRDLSPQDIEVNSDADQEEDPEFDGDGEPSVVMYTTIQGEYNPPPDVDFSEVVGDAFDEKGDAFVEDLKKDPTGFFEEATGVKAATVSFPLPTEEELRPKTVDPKEENSWTRYVYIGCGVLGSLVVVGVVVFVVVRRRRRRTRDGKLQESAKSLDDLDEEELAMSASCQNSRLVPSSTNGGSGGNGGGRLLGDCRADGVDTDDCSFASSIRTIDTKTSAKTSKSYMPSQ